MRLDYDFQQAENDFFKFCYYEEAGPLARFVLLELRTANSNLYLWATKYQEPALLD